MIRKLFRFITKYKLILLVIPLSIGAFLLVRHSQVQQEKSNQTVETNPVINTDPVAKTENETIKEKRIENDKDVMPKVIEEKPTDPALKPPVNAPQQTALEKNPALANLIKEYKFLNTDLISIDYVDENYFNGMCDLKNENSKNFYNPYLITSSTSLYEGSKPLQHYVLPSMLDNLGNHSWYDRNANLIKDILDGKFSIGQKVEEPTIAFILSGSHCGGGPAADDIIYDLQYPGTDDAKYLVRYGSRHFAAGADLTQISFILLSRKGAEYSIIEAGYYPIMEFLTSSTTIRSCEDAKGYIILDNETSAACMENVIRTELDKSKVDATISKIVEIFKITNTTEPTVSAQ